MNYNERGADPQGGVAQNPRVGAESGDLRKIREAIGLLRLILDARGPWHQDLGRGHHKNLWENHEGSETEDLGKTIGEDPGREIPKGITREGSVESSSEFEASWNNLDMKLEIFRGIPLY